MKKIALTLVFLIALSITCFAEEGDIHTGGKTCQQGQSCLVAPTNPGTKDKTIFTDILDFLKSIFK